MCKALTFLNLLFILTFFSCEQEAQEAEVKSIDPRLIYGQWRNVTMKLQMNTYRNSDSAFTLEVDEKNWEKVMNIRLIRTFFWSDSTYNSLHINLNDSLIYNPSGRWTLVKDSLFMTDTFPKKGPVYRYKLKIKDEVAEFTGVEDLDGDGKADDNYYGTQRRVGRHR